MALVYTYRKVYKYNSLYIIMVKQIIEVNGNIMEFEYHMDGDMFVMGSTNEPYEFGYKIGSLEWAYRVAEKEGKVYDSMGALCTLDDDGRMIWGNDGNTIPVMDCLMTGWNRKKSDKEELFNRLFELSGNENIRIEFLGILDNYEITKK